jgi:hypothetical protein
MPEQTAPPAKGDSRTLWIVTGYAAALLGLLGVLAYHFSNVLDK